MTELDRLIVRAWSVLTARDLRGRLRLPFFSEPDRCRECIWVDEGNAGQRVRVHTYKPGCLLRFDADRPTVDATPPLVRGPWPLRPEDVKHGPRDVGGACAFCGALDRQPCFDMPPTDSSGAASDRERAVAWAQGAWVASHISEQGYDRLVALLADVRREALESK